MTNRQNIPSWLPILILVGLGISVGPRQILTRTSEVSRALSPVLSSYEVIRMEPGEIERQVRTTGELRFRFNDTDFYFNLEPHDLRSPNYRAMETGPGGVSRELPPQPVHTFKGVLAGQEDTRGRFNLVEGGVEGVVYGPDGRVYLEPLRNYLAAAPAGELVVYGHADIKPGEALKCGVSLVGRLERGVNRIAAQVTSGTPTRYVAEVATEADYEYVQALGGSIEAIREILGIMNQVEGVYQSELLLQLRIGFQHAWTAEDDPYTATNSLDLLNQFGEYWNTHYAAQKDYDIAHLWTDRERDDSVIGGRAAPSVACSVRSASYGLSTYQTGIPRKYVTPAHEIGHNFGANHPDQVNPAVEGCTNTIMSSSIYGGRGDPGLTFCQFSRQEIAGYVSDHNGCLIPQPITLQTPSRLSARAVSSSRIELDWQDNNASRSDSVVQRRRDGSGEWVRIGVIAAGVDTLVDDGLFPSTTYVYRVQAFSGTESSAFSNEASATTLAGSVAGSDWTIDTIAGGRNNEGDYGPAIEARLRDPDGLAVDGEGNLYIADSGNSRVRRVDAAGAITTVAGTGERGYRGDGGPANRAPLVVPIDVAVDGAGNLYIADSARRVVRRVSRSGTITTVAGTGVWGYSGDGGPANQARLASPTHVAVDGAGNLYIADGGNHRVRRVSRSGTITTVAGTGVRGYSGDGGPALLARISVSGLAVDRAGNFYIADWGNHRIRRVSRSGLITTVAGTGVQGYSGDGGPASQARLAFPRFVAVDGAGNLYIVDSGNHRIRRMSRSGVITTVAGTGVYGYSGDGGPALAARISASGLAADGAGNLYAADRYNHRIRRIDSSGTITTFAGIGESGYRGDGGSANQARLFRPWGVVVDRSGNFYVADKYNHRIRRVDISGTITTIAGTGEEGYSGDGGPAVAARLASPGWVELDGSGNLYISDTSNNRIRQVDASGIITTVVGTGEPGYSGDGGPAVAAKLWDPHGMVFDGAGNLFFADGGNQRIRRVDRGGKITTVAGSGESGFAGDGGPAVAAKLWIPKGVALDGAGNLYIADNANHRIRRVDRAGIITTIAGVGLGDFTAGPGPAITTALDSPTGVAVDKAGNVYIADSYYSVLRRIDTAGTISIFAGDIAGYSGDGGPASQAQLFFPREVTLDHYGDIYVSDTWNHRVRVLAQPLPLPTRLSANPVSPYQISLAWQDNSHGELGFTVQRLSQGTSHWVEVGTTAANDSRFSDTGLRPATSYRYRVRAFKRTVASPFSNQAEATTSAALAPAITDFTPRSGPIGTPVTLTGTHLLSATDVGFNGVSAQQYVIVSGSTIDTAVPPGAASGPISVDTPGGTAVSTQHFRVTTGFHRRLFVPVVLRSRGRTPGSLFTSELTLTNRGSTTAEIHYNYRAAFGGGSGTAVDFLEAGRQRIIPDAIAYLDSLGVPIGDGAAGGTLAVEFTNLSSETVAAVTVRTSTPVEGGAGQAGLAYVGVPPEGLLTGTTVVAGLRQNTQDRSNLAVQNAGDASYRAITLRVTVYSGDPEAPGSLVLPDLSLPPGGFHQYNEILTEAGFDNGYVKVERVSGTAPYYAYGVINDNFNSDGSFVFPVEEESLRGTRGQTLPVIVETRDFTSELTVTNFSSSEKQVDFSFVADAIETDRAATFSLRLQAGEQSILPSIVDHLRGQGVAGIGPAGRAFAGALFALAAEGDMSGVVIGARTGSPGGGGQYGVFYNAAPDGSASTGSTWIYGLQRNATNRSNLALVNTGEVDNGRSRFSLGIYDGETGRLVKTVTTRAIPARGWRQINGILGAYARGTRQGYVEVRKLSGNNPFLAYGVVNDGGAPGERSGDGAYLPRQ